MNDLEKTRKLQEQLANNEVKVADAVKYSGLSRQAINDLKSGKTKPERARAGAVELYAQAYDILQFEATKRRDILFGNILGILDAVHPLTENDFRDANQHPSTAIMRISERYHVDYTERMNKAQPLLSKISVGFPIDEYDDRPLGPAYILSFNRIKGDAWNLLAE